jgi:hypothetical protein
VPDKKHASAKTSIGQGGSTERCNSIEIFELKGVGGGWLDSGTEAEGGAILGVTRKRSVNVALSRGYKQCPWNRPDSYCGIATFYEQFGETPFVEFYFLGIDLIRIVGLRLLIRTAAHVDDRECPRYLLG